MKIALTGAKGQLGSFFASYLEKSNFTYDCFTRKDWDISSKEQSELILAKGDYDILINCAAYTDVEKAETDQEACMDINAEALMHLSDQCKRRNVLLVHFSTDYVFDGDTNIPYKESAKPNPLNVYGASKLEGEKIIEASGCEHLIGRVSWLFGGQEVGFPSKLEQWRTKTNQIKVSSDEISSPTFAGHIPAHIFLAIQKKLSGLYHINSTGKCSRYDWATFYAQQKKWKETIIEPAQLRSFKMKARRPYFSVMNNMQFQNQGNTKISTWKDAVIESCR